MRIALTGSSGFIGQCLLREWGGKHSFLAFTSHPHHSELYQHESIEYVPVDYNVASEDAFAGLSTCDAAVNLGFRRPVVGRADTFADYLQSVATSDCFMKACHDAGLNNVVHVSSRSVYSKKRPIPHDEDEPIEPFSFYGAAKAAAEADALACNSVYGMHVKVLRLAQVIGVNEYQGVVSRYLAAAKAGEPLQIWGTGDESAREYLYVRDASAAIMAAFDHPSVCGVFNAGTGQAANALQLVGILKEVVGDNLAVQFYPEKSVEHMDYCMKVEKARDVLEWQAAWSLHDALAAMYADDEGLY